MSDDGTTTNRLRGHCRGRRLRRRLPFIGRPESFWSPRLSPPILKQPLQARSFTR